MDYRPSGIKHLDANTREMFAAALSVGTKGESGAPTDKDRFYIVNPNARIGTFKKRDGGTYSSPMRDPHPSYAKFNTEPDVTRRQSIPIRLCHWTEGEAFVGSLFSKELPGFPKRPNHAPSCVGDGEMAMRWLGEKDGLKEIRCGGENCEFWKKPCKPRMVFVARFDFPRTADGRGLPNVVFKYMSSSIYTYLNFRSFFNSFKKACIGLGVNPDTVPLFGLPALMTLSERTSGGGESGKRFPTVSISINGDGDMITWIQEQLHRRDEIRRLASSAPVPALTDKNVIEGVFTDDADLVEISVPQR